MDGGGRGGERNGGGGEKYMTELALTCTNSIPWLPCQ